MHFSTQGFSYIHYSETAILFHVLLHTQVRLSSIREREREGGGGRGRERQFSDHCCIESLVWRMLVAVNIELNIPQK